MAIIMVNKISWGVVQVIRPWIEISAPAAAVSRVHVAYDHTGASHSPSVRV